MASKSHLLKPVEPVGSDTIFIPRTSTIARFDTVVFNPENGILAVWRYRIGKYLGTHEIVLSAIDMDQLIKNSSDLRKLCLVIAKVASLHVISEEYDLPEPWIGYRFV